MVVLMDLFTQNEQQAVAGVAPLAVRMRPSTLDEFVGQEHFLGPGKLLRRMLQADRLSSAIFYGPPGTGKTTLAHIIAQMTHAAFEELNAASAGVKEVRTILEQARARLTVERRRTILFVDELHRFNKAQQDVLLDDVEKGVVIFIGATTENPFFYVNTPLVSRSQIFHFETLTTDHIRHLMQRALDTPQRGFGDYNITITPEALDHLVRRADGDARRALTALEVAVHSQLANALSPGQGLVPVRTSSADHVTTPTIAIDLAVAQESIQQKAIRYDKLGDEHYDAASALIKSMRGSDPDAAVYWLARMLDAGEDPRFIARRIAICAAEDIGNADPMALVLASAAFQITLQVGLSECQLPLAQAAIYLACAPKSNASAQAIWQASSEVREGLTIPVPKHLRDAHYSGAQRLGHGSDYQYAHDSADGYVEQDYLGVERQYYQPTDRGHEKIMKLYLDKLRQKP
ncbi:MAG: putative AAA domain-containing protein [Phycisphaerae bacterium]|nr:putative AAA domain-containing protein [Phycisphaerae bacterium]